MYVWDEKPLTTVLIVQVNLFPSQGQLPRTIDEVMERAKDIQYSSKQRVNTEHVRELGELRAALGRHLAKLPPELRADEDARKLALHCDARDWTIAYLTNSHRSGAGNAKDAEFSRVTVNERWAAGLEDVHRSLANIEWTRPMDLGPGIRVHFLPAPTPANK
jgi:NTE family protein